MGSSILFFLRALYLASFAPVQVFSFATETENWLSEKWENFNTEPAGTDRRTAGASTEGAANRNCVPGFLELLGARDLQSGICLHGS